MAKVTIEVDDEILRDIEAVAADFGVSAADFFSVMAADGAAQYHAVVALQAWAARRDKNAALQKSPSEDPLGVDTSNEDAAIRQMCDNALNGRNEDAIKAEVAIAERWFTRR